MEWKKLNQSFLKFNENENENEKYFNKQENQTQKKAHENILFVNNEKVYILLIKKRKEKPNYYIVLNINLMKI